MNQSFLTDVAITSHRQNSHVTCPDLVEQSPRLSLCALTCTKSETQLNIHSLVVLNSIFILLSFSTQYSFSCRAHRPHSTPSSQHTELRVHRAPRKATRRMHIKMHAYQDACISRRMHIKYYKQHQSLNISNIND